MKARDNPFSPARLERVLAFDPLLIGVTWESLEERWAALGKRAAVTGKRGAGKTTLLAAWEKRLRARGTPVQRLFFNQQARRLSPEDRAKLAQPAGQAFLVDGEEHLPWLERRELRLRLKAAGGVLLARHARGPWPELLRLETSGRLAAELLRRALPGEADAYLPDLERRLAARSGNLRELWFQLYDELSGDPETASKTF